jgi:hypothetical protein
LGALAVTYFFFHPCDFFVKEGTNDFFVPSLRMPRNEVLEKKGEKHLFGIVHLQIVFGSSNPRDIGNSPVVEHLFDVFRKIVHRIFIPNPERLKKRPEPFETDSLVLIGIEVHIWNHAVSHRSYVVGKRVQRRMPIHRKFAKHERHDREFVLFSKMKIPFVPNPLMPFSDWNDHPDEFVRSVGFTKPIVVEKGGVSRSDKGKSIVRHKVDAVEFFSEQRGRESGIRPSGKMDDGFVFCHLPEGVFENLGNLFSNDRVRRFIYVNLLFQKQRFFGGCIRIAEIGEKFDLPDPFVSEFDEEFLPFRSELPVTADSVGDENVKKARTVFGCRFLESLNVREGFFERRDIGYGHFSSP